MQVNVVITQNDTSGKKLTTTISYVNGEASNAALATLAQSLNALTTNLYISASKETKGEIL